jgi:hypothetical protein
MDSLVRIEHPPTKWTTWVQIPPEKQRIDKPKRSKKDYEEDIVQVIYPQACSILSSLIFKHLNVSFCYSAVYPNLIFISELSI